MKRNKGLWQLLLLPILVLTLVGCSYSSQSAQVTKPSSDLPLIDQFESLSKEADDYLSSNKLVSMSPEQLYQEVVLGKNTQYFLVDIRANQDFVNSNIRGSVSIPYNQTANPQKLASLPKDKTLVIIDYNGHWAAQTAATWNQLGYRAVPLLYGIQSWTQEEAPSGYEAFPSQALANPLVKEVATFNQHNLPEVKYAQGKTKEYIIESTGTYLDRSYKGFITAEDLLGVLQQDSEGDYYVVDIRQQQHYLIGHLEGSVNIPLAKLAETEMLKHLPVDKKIILIGYDGMDASQGTRVLVTLGYDAVALKYGMSYWHGDENVTGIGPIPNLVKDYYKLFPLNYVQPSTGAAGCG